jgi:soluble lytic murein transglycosylase-like protein
MSWRPGTQPGLSAEPALLRRRGFLLSLHPLAGLLAAGITPNAHAGRQLEEPLADAVRTALSASIESQAPPVPEFEASQARDAHERWLNAMGARLTRQFPEAQIRREFLQTVWYEATRAGLELGLVLGLIQVESGFRKFAVSSAGARGFMQVMPFWSRLIGDGDAAKLFHMQTNLRFGCVILRHYLDRERGELFMALGRYNGSRGQAPYPNAVLAAGRQWAMAG